MNYDQRMAIINSHQFKTVERALATLMQQYDTLMRLDSENSGFIEETSENLHAAYVRLGEAIEILSEAKNNMLLDEDFAKFLTIKPR
jgi:hypothetical protein